MRVRSLVLALALLGFVGQGIAQETFFAPDTDGCVTYAPYTWTELVPGGRWQATVDLSQCSSADLGLFVYYGYFAKNTSADTLKKQYGIVVSVQNLDTGQVYSAPADKRSDETINLTVGKPAQFLLTAENRGRNTAKIRMTWMRVQQ